LIVAEVIQVDIGARRRDLHRAAAA
jgi:hypothetical protein